MSYGNVFVRSISSAIGAISCSANSRTVERSRRWSGGSSKSMRPIVTYGRRRSPGGPQADVPDAVVPVEPPPVRLGTLQAGGLAPAMLGLVDRGVRLRPGPA